MESFIRQAEELTLWAETFGDPSHPAVLLIMGAMGQGTFWPDRFCEQLAQSGHFVIRYDHRDTGRSSTVSALHPYTLNALTSDAVAVLDGLETGEAFRVESHQSPMENPLTSPLRSHPRHGSARGHRE